MELFLLYVWLRLNVLLVWGTIFCVAALIIAVVLGIILFSEWPTEYDKKHEPEKAAAWESGFRWFRKSVFTTIWLFVFLLLCPDKEDTAYLVAGHFAIEAAHSPEAAKLVSLLRGKVNEYLNEQIAKLPAAAASAASAATK